MTSNLFKTRYLLNVYGTTSTLELTNANTVFLHTYLGDDTSGDGTREKPYRSLSKSVTKLGVSYVVFRGVINESIDNNGKHIVGDDINQTIICSNFRTNIWNETKFNYNFTVDIFKGYDYFPNAVNIIINDYQGSSQNNALNSGFYCLFKKLTSFATSGPSLLFSHCSFESMPKTVFGTPKFYNDIFFRSFDFYNVNYVKYSVFPTTCSFKYDGVNIIQPLFTNNSKTNVSLLRSALIDAGVSSVSSLIPIDSFGNETCFIIKETRSGGNHVPIFNRYSDNLTGTTNILILSGQTKTNVQLVVADSSLFPTTGDIFIPNISGDGSEVFTYTSVTINSPTLITFNGSSYTFKVSHLSGVTCTRYGDVLDFTLNPDPINEALWASDTGGFVGCFRPAENTIINSGITIINVDSGGTDTIIAGDLLQIDSSNNFIFNLSSLQTWNRYKDTSTTVIPNGSNFKGLNAMSQDGSPYGYYIGKNQNPIDTTIVNTGDTLTSGTWYKVFNDVSKDVTKSIIYNNVQYLPSYTFQCSGVTGFTLLNTGSGSYVKKINCDILESIEIFPYDDISTPSSFPKFSAPLMGECKLLFYTSAGAIRYGTTIGNPVLFIDLSGTNFQTDFPNLRDKISYYDNYAISNADQEFFTLADPSLIAPKSTYFTVSIPILKFLRREINAHYDEKYNY